MGSRRFPFPTPFGWFQVAFPGDLEPGEVTPLSYWNRELVLWRDHAGDFYSSSYVIRTVPQEMSENGVDPAHFRYVHGTDDVAEMESYDTDGPCSVMLSKQSYVTPRGVTHGRIDVYNYGPGFSKVWFSGIVDAINVATTTPIDDDTTQVRFNFVVRKFDDEKLTSTVAAAFVKEINKQVQEDKPIWEHKVFLPTPALADTDGPIMKFRKWYSQFYAEPYEVGAG